ARRCRAGQTGHPQGPCCCYLCHLHPHQGFPGCLCHVEGLWGTGSEDTEQAAGGRRCAQRRPGGARCIGGLLHATVCACGAPEEAAEGRRDSQKPLWEPHPEVLWLFPTCLDSRPGSWDLSKGIS
ncbi:hypothetical protein MC885_002520, partial [Smutsia gigantea]